MTVQEKRNQWIGLLVVILTVGLYLYAQIDVGGIPHDEGLLGQSAERVTYGELPHRDFDDPYTGGQALFHAWAFKLFGPGTLATRYVLYLMSMLFFVVYYLFLCRFANAWLSVLVTWTAVTWSLPNYFAALPSWYNLFFATFGMWGLLLFTESNRKRWLLFAGLMGGLSFLIKLSGVFYLAAGILYLVFYEQAEHRGRRSEEGRNRSFSIFSTTCLALFVAGLASLVRSRSTVMDWLVFVAPSAILATYLIFAEWRLSPGETKTRFQNLFRYQLLFLFGALLPIAVFLLMYSNQESLQRWWNGVFVLPQKRVAFADYPLPPVSSLVATIPLILFLILASSIRRRLDTWWLVIAFSILATASCLLGAEETIYTGVWNATRPSVLCLVVFGVYSLWRRDHESISTTDEAPNIGSAVPVDGVTDAEPSVRPFLRHLAFLILAMTAMTAWVQFPYSFGIYFCYVAPLVIATGFVLHQFACVAMPRIGVVMLLFLCMFAALWLNTSRIQRMGVSYLPRDNNAVLKVERSGLRVTTSEADLYEGVVEIIQAHSDPGDFIYASLDCPEIYFLSGRRNPTRTFYDFFEPDFEGPTTKRIERIAELLDAKEVKVVVFKWQGEFSGALPLDLAETVASRFPNVQHFVRQSQVGRESAPVFSVAWRD